MNNTINLGLKAMVASAYFSLGYSTLNKIYLRRQKRIVWNCRTSESGSETTHGTSIVEAGDPLTPHNKLIQAE